LAISRREFISGSAAALSVPAVTKNLPPAYEVIHDVETVGPVTSRHLDLPGFDPVLEVDGAAIRHNVAEVSRLCSGRPILAVVKNNGYGLGVSNVGRILDGIDAVAGLAVVKADEAIALRDTGVRKPVLLMGLFSEAEGAELAARNIHLAPYTEGIHRTLARYAETLAREIPVHIYLDTGMNRVGVPFRRAIPWIVALANQAGVRIDGTFMCFAEDDAFDSEQMRRFMNVASAARNRGVDLGQLHAASTHGVFFRPNALLDMVRPGLALYGAYPAGASGLGLAKLHVAFSLRCRVVRVERLEAGDGVSYGQNYVAEHPTWVATLPVGHADGYPRGAVNGCEVLIGGRLFKVIGAVSASHTIVELGAEEAVEIGAEATLIGADVPAVYPNTIAERAEISVYDILMHLSARLSKRIAKT
jgi:alanine racemase